MESKPAWQSKTLWANVVLAIAPFIPGAGPWIVGHPNEYGWLMAGLNVVLRCISEKKLSFKIDV